MDVALFPNIEPKNSVTPGTSSEKTKPTKKTMTSVYLKFFETYTFELIKSPLAD